MLMAQNHSIIIHTQRDTRVIQVHEHERQRHEVLNLDYLFYDGEVKIYW